MRKVTIDFTKSPVEISSMILGKQGEHKATELIITPPTEMSENEEIISYAVAFQIGAYKKCYSLIAEKAETIAVLVERDVTQVNYLSIQLEAYDGNENLLVKSERIDGFVLEPSVIGDEQETHMSSSAIEQVTANTSFRNNFGEDENGNLTYKGTSVSGRDYKTITLVSGEFGVFPSDYGAEIVLYTSEIPVGAEIRTIRFVYEGQTIDIRNLTAINSVPYILHMGEVYTSPQAGIPVVAFIGDYIMLIGGVWQASRSFILQAIESYEVPQIEIDYYT